MRDRLGRGGPVTPPGTTPLPGPAAWRGGGRPHRGGSSNGGGGSSGPQTIIVGTLPIANAAPMYLGMKKGFFEAEGLKIKPHVGEGGAALIPALMSNQDQFAF